MSTYICEDKRPKKKLLNTETYFAALEDISQTSQVPHSLTDGKIPLYGGDR